MISSNFSASIGSKLSDPIENRNLFSGYQIPFYSKFRSRYISLLGFKYPRLYFRFSSDMRKISLFHKRLYPKDKSGRIKPRLLEGFIGDYSLEFSVPLAFDQVFSLKYFVELHGKYVLSEFSNMVSSQVSKGQESTYLGKLKTGISFSLPIEGYFLFKEQGKFENSLRSLRSDIYLEHRADFSLDFYYFPKPLAHGPYGDIFREYYFEKDTRLWTSQRLFIDPLVYTQDDKNYMFAEKVIKFSTRQSLSSFHKTTIRSFRDRNSSAVSFLEQARDELFSFQSEDGFTNSFQEKRSQYFHFLTLYSELSYDFEKMMMLEKVRNLGNRKSLFLDSKKTIEPFSPLFSKISIDFIKLKLDLKSEYNFYYQDFSEISIMSSIFLPFSFIFSPSFSISREEDKFFSYENPSTKSIYKQTFSLALPFIKNSLVKYFFEIQRTPSENSFFYSKGVSFSYEAPSKCWGGLFSWSLSGDNSSPFGSYYFSLFMKFAEKSFEFGNLATYLQAEPS